ncbi:hypothetical protein [Xenorhabdus cabanillasii]|uniref:Lytic transglycosylase n=1 Tax=Xenorhabdus cabanillasii JM26 TaxID=1427517 RepID=W1J9N7_9GAMM|nr:hypothetical protein [Xenorhabdus cabanillasii]PHM75636.1 hypothetical protein Xcab_03854 [Xenorhabdus cabanillasii JM26]CDL86220.1 conserved hypothetical protein [Xenorhabdus cabanillasii JM26]
MSQSYFYCETWSLGYQKAHNLLSEEEAYQKHLKGKPYTVLVGSNSRPSCVISIIKTKDFVSVEFLDDNLKEYLSYQFHVLENEKLFLTMVVYREFAEKEGEGEGLLNVSKGTCFFYKKDGTYTIREETFKPHTVIEKEGFSDLKENYDTFPEFGCYESLIQKER